MIRTPPARPTRAIAIVSALALIGAASAAGPDRRAKGDRVARHAAPAGLRLEAAAPDTGAAVHLLSRATYGVRREDLERVLAMGLEAWLDEQLHPERIDDSDLLAGAGLFPAAVMDQRELLAAYPPREPVRRRESTDPSAPSARGPDSARAAPARAGMGPGRILFDLTGAKLERAVHGERQLEEVMTDFWFNHFNVFFAKGPERWLVGEYERDAIRPFVFGSFEDMLVATARHPAMLFYLDNWRNAAPDSLRRPDRDADRLRALPAGVRRRLLEREGISGEQIERIERALERRGDREPGINENYARELLELHTIGVDAGYSQTDVIEVARAFTGWTIARPGRAMETGTGPGGRAWMELPPEIMLGESEAAALGFAFAYRPGEHDPTDKLVLGNPIAGRSGSAGYEEGREILSLLARHPATARHIAVKLATAFAADDPPPALVDELERTFLGTGGDLGAVTRTLFTSPLFYDPELRGAKLKSPFELVASALRVSGVRVGPSRALFEQLRAMGELPYMASAPTGYPDRAEYWGSSGALLQRVNFAIGLASGEMRGARVPMAALPTGDDPAADVVAWVLPGTPASDLIETIRGELSAAGAARAATAADRTAVRRLALGLALGSPLFQHR